MFQKTQTLSLLFVWFPVTCCRMIEDLSSDCQCNAGHSGTTIACNYGNRTDVPKLLLASRSYLGQESWKSLVVFGNSNVITFPLDYFTGIKNIDTLSFHDIKLQSIPNIFENLQHVYTMDLSGNRIEIISTNNLQKLGVRLLNLSKNSISYLEPEDLSWIPSMEILDLSDNKIAEIPKGFFRTTRLIRKVVLSFNSLTVISKHVFSGLEATLQDLYLGENLISDIHPLAFSNLIELKLLDLSGNPLNPKIDILSSLKLPQHIAHLDLQRTALTTFPFCFVHDLHDLEYINLQENYLECSCDLVWVAQHLKHHYYPSRDSQPEQLAIQCLSTDDRAETMSTLKQDCINKPRQPCSRTDPLSQLQQRLHDLHYVVEIRKGKIWMHWGRVNSSMVYAYRITVKEEGKDNEYFYGPVTIHPSSDHFTIESFDLKNTKLIVCLHVMANATGRLYKKCVSVEDESLSSIVGILAGIIFLVPCLLALGLVIYYDRNHKRRDDSNRTFLKTSVSYSESSRETKTLGSSESSKSIVDVEGVAGNRKSIADGDGINESDKGPFSDVRSAESEDVTESISLLITEEYVSTV